MFHLLKKHAAAEEGKGPETVVGVQHTPGDRLDSNPVVSVALCILVFIILTARTGASPYGIMSPRPSCSSP